MPVSEKKSDGFWCLVAVVVSSLSLFKGIRLPSRYAATQAQIDYSQGIVKRGFFGQWVYIPLGLGHYALFTVFSFALLALFFVFIIVLALRSRHH